METVKESRTCEKTPTLDRENELITYETMAKKIIGVGLSVTLITNTIDDCINDRIKAL